MSGKHPWWHIGLHFWTHSTDEDFRKVARASQDGMERFLVGSFEAREIRTCSYCGRQEQRDVYGGNYIPYDWQLRRYTGATNV